MERRWRRGLALLVWALWPSPVVVWAQQTPDMILHNGKIVTVDNHEVNSNLGTIAQAIAIREGKIVSVGSNADIRRLAGRNTALLDLKGRTVTPGFATTHDHPHDWNLLNPAIVKKVVTDDMHIERFLNAPPDEVVQQFPRVLDEAVHKAKPGQWIRISLLAGPEMQWNNSGLLGRQINKEMLDLAAPNNPVVVRGSSVGMLVNQKAIEKVSEFYGEEREQFPYQPLGDLYSMPAAVPGVIEKTGVCSVCYRYVEQDVLYPSNALTEIYRLGLSWMAGFGLTLNATSLYTGAAIRAYDTLDRRGQMPIRFAWGYFWPFRNDFFRDPYLVHFVRAQEGKGSDYLWIHGMTSHMGMDCNELPASAEVKQQERACGFADPTIARALYEYVKAGGRLAGDHMDGDKEIDLALDIIEKASKDAGMTLEEIRAKRHVMEHMTMWPRPDQIPRLKKLGVMTSGRHSFGGGEAILKKYGERGVMQMQPRKSLYEAGIMNSVEIDSPYEYTTLTYFEVLYAGITRKDKEGRTWAPEERISREAMLKSATLWGAYGALREEVLGSLEPGKWADLAVLDSDYLTIPVEDIPNIRVLMTMVGGKVVHLVPSLAHEWGMQPTGAQVELGGPASNW